MWPYLLTLVIGIVTAILLNKKYPTTFGGAEGDLTVHTGYVPSEDRERLDRALDIVEKKLVGWYLSDAPSPRLGAFLERTRSELRLMIRVLIMKNRYADLKQVREETNRSSRLTG